MLKKATIDFLKTLVNFGIGFLALSLFLIGMHYVSKLVTYITRDEDEDDDDEEESDKRKTETKIKV